MYKILINDGLDKEALNSLEKLGVEVVNNHYDKEVLIEKIKEFHCIVIRSQTKLTEDILKEGAKGNLKLVIRGGVGIDNIDVSSAKRFGITVMNTPKASSNAVAELALAHILSVSRFLGISNVTMREGFWNKKDYKGKEILGKTLGIIGMGRIGQALAKKAKALGMNIIYYTIEGKHDDLDYEFLSFYEVLAKSDFISIHVPYDKEKGSLIGKNEFEKMKDGIYLINCSRGKVVDEEALLYYLNLGKVSGAGIDVFEEEPIKNLKLVNNPNVSVTPHIGASTIEAQNRIGREIVKIIKEFFKI